VVDHVMLPVVDGVKWSSDNCICDAGAYYVWWSKLHATNDWASRQSSAR